jgi:RNA polymerase sigma-70 factor (ECF subfamily)
MVDLAVAHDEIRPLMCSIAYRMLGSVAEAEDVVQDGLVRIHTAIERGERIESLDAFATTVTTRLAIDTLRSARVRREEYVGEWLPEPLVDGGQLDPAAHAEVTEGFSFASLALLERLTPVERAVYVLREGLEYDFADIATVVERSEAACRQLLHRARERMSAGTPRFEADPARQRQLAETFLAALRDGDVAALEQLLLQDIEFHADGGGRVRAVAQPVIGQTRVVRFLLGLSRQGRRFGTGVELVQANGQPAVMVRTPAGELLSIMVLDLTPDGVRRIDNQLNPDKLHRLGPLGDFDALPRVQP